MAPSSEFLFATLMVDEASALDAFVWMQSVAEADGKRQSSIIAGGFHMGNSRRQRVEQSIY